MKKIHVNLMFVLLAAIVFILLGSETVNAVTLGEVETIPVSDYTKQKESEISVRFNGDIPYVSLVDIYSYISPYDITVNKVESGIYEVTTLQGKATINTEKDTLVSDNYAKFVFIPDVEEELPAFLKSVNEELTGVSSKTNIDFSKYEIDLYGDDQNVWLPVTVFFDMFMKMGLYDGTSINVLDINYTTAFTNSNEYYNIIKGFLNEDKRKSGYNNIFYNELCFILDNFYGYPGKCVISEMIKEKGLDATLESYNDDTRKIKNWLLSENLEEFYYGLSLLNAYLNDGGHTNIVGTLETYLYLYLGQEKMEPMLDNLLQIDQYKTSLKFYAESRDKRTLIGEAREAIFDDSSDFYAESGDTAIFTLDDFEHFDAAGWKNYYSNGGEYPNDNLGNLLIALDMASSNPNIKNFVIDISKNGGGFAFLAPAIMAHLGYENNLTSRNMINNQINVATEKVDINHDGIYDEKDKISKYNFNYAVLTSGLTFSTGNVFATFAKENGFMVLGEQSGGGACSRTDMFFLEGIFSNLSSLNHYVNKSGISVDGGVSVDKNLVEVNDNRYDFSKYYDLQLLSSAINEFYGNNDDKDSETPATETIYEYTEGANQTYTIGEDGATFRINADYSLFENGGKVYVDDELVSSDNYTSKPGSTIITFTKDYMSSLSEGEHTLKVAFNNGGTAITKFTVSKASTPAEETAETNATKGTTTSNNPKTGDNIVIYGTMFVVGLVGIFASRKLKGSKIAENNNKM